MQVQSGVAEKWEKVQTGTANGNVPAAEYADAAMAIISVSPICRASRLRPWAFTQVYSTVGSAVRRRLRPQQLPLACQSMRTA